MGPEGGRKRKRDRKSKKKMKREKKKRQVAKDDLDNQGDKEIERDYVCMRA